jgi:branched-chain amino acid transport system ATP-binding protein
MLDVKNLRVHYGMVQAVKGVSFQVFAREIVTLIGANGAGKTTILKGLSGLVPTEGRIVFQNQEIQGLSPELRVQRSFIHCPEGRGVFSNMTVLENLELGAYLRSDKAQIASDMDRVLKMFPRLQERLEQMAGTLSGGEQQMLAISRSMMSRPQILLLDEPSLGLAPKVVSQIFEILTQLNSEGMTILLVEQNAHMALSIAHRAYVLETGTIAMTGTGRELLSSSEVQRHYLGM